MASAFSLINPSTISFSFSLTHVSIPIICSNSSKQFNRHKKTSFRYSINPSSSRRNPKTLIVKAAEYKFPDPIPEFAEAETEKFREHLIEKLSKKEVFEDSVDEVVEICSEVFSIYCCVLEVII
uniref:Protein plastid REDOX insensitive 2, chloroplastic n=1 Tax=Tanacetum cinerariifolium TaxID=118510 RepID=A0A6L2LPE5_TANCI|nr:protein plastid REDOX insensitive 2, chloroplastic [Tanacetum cinerariifolium]